MWHGHAVQKWQTRSVNTILGETSKAVAWKTEQKEGRKVNESGPGLCPLAGFAVLNLGVLLPQCCLGTTLRIRHVRFLGTSQASLESKMTAVGWKSGFWCDRQEMFLFSITSWPSLGASPVSYPAGSRGSLPGGKTPGVWLWLLTSMCMNGSQTFRAWYHLKQLNKCLHSLGGLMLGKLQNLMF
jgi:hypothetical protein